MLNWGLIGGGAIAYVFCNSMRFSSTGRILAVASCTQSKADTLAADFDISRKYTNYEDLLTDEEIDAVYISTINPLHAEWAIKSAEAKKHILVEKPIGMNYAEAEAMVKAARENDVFLMEAFMYRCHPQVKRMVELIQDGVIGEIHLIQATFGIQAKFDPNARIYSHERGGGAILDLGCYTASMARLIAGAPEQKRFLEPVLSKGSGKVGPTGVDHIGVASVQFENAIIAELIAAFEGNIGQTVSIFGSNGIMTIQDPWLPSTPCRYLTQPLPLDATFPPSKIRLQSHQASEASEIIVEVDRDLFTYEADVVASHVEDRQAPVMCWDDTLGNMKLLDTWREEIGVIV